MTELRKVIQNYIGMEPRDHSCKNWAELILKMEAEIMKVIKSDPNLFSAQEIREKLLKINPQVLKNSKTMNPFLYEDISKWYNELGE